MKEVQSQIKNLVSNLSDFLHERAETKKNLNQEFNSLQERMKKEAKENKRKILLSLSLETTVVFNIGEQIRGVFDYQNHKYPENGLILRAVEFVHCEHVGDLGIYYTFINVVFQTDHQGFVGEIGIGRIGFDDETLRIIDNSMGICYQPKFNDSEDYFEIKEAIQLMKEKITEATKLFEEKTDA